MPCSLSMYGILGGFFCFVFSPVRGTDDQGVEQVEGRYQDYAGSGQLLELGLLLFVVGAQLVLHHTCWSTGRLQRVLFVFGHFSDVLH